MRITARLSYGLRALALMAGTGGEPVKGRTIARGCGLSVGFLEVVLGDLRRAGLVASKRGGRGGYWLTRPADSITVADVIRVLDGEGPDARPGAPHDDLSAVWDAITAGYMDAARRITVAQLAATRPGSGPGSAA